MKNLHLAGILSGTITTIGIVSSLGVLPVQWAAAITGFGMILQAFTKPVNAGNTNLVPKS